MPIGIFVCSGSLVVWAIAGAFLNKFIPEQFKKTLPLISGLISMSMGVFFLVKLINLPPIALAMILGTIIGGLLNIEKWIERAGSRLRAYRLNGSFQSRRVPTWTRKIISISLLRC